MDYTVHGILQARVLEWVPFPSPGDLPNPGVKSRSPTLQADSLPAELQGKPRNTGVGSLSLLQRIFPTQGSNWGLLHCRRILYQLSNEGSPYSTFKNRILGLPWLTRGWDIILLLQGARVWSLVEELGSHMLHATTEQGENFFLIKIESLHSKSFQMMQNWVYSLSYCLGEQRGEYESIKTSRIC